MTAVGSAGGGAMMMWVATHNAKSQEQANAAVDKARDMLDLEKKVTEIRQKMSGAKSPAELASVSAEINAYLEANKDSPHFEEINEVLGPMAESVGFEAAKATLAEVANRKYPTEEDINRAKEAVKNPKIRAAYPEITKAIENGRFEGETKNGGREYKYQGTNWREIDANASKGDDDGAQAFDRKGHLREKDKELSRLQRDTEDFADMTSKERELLMTEASEKRDAARQTNEAGAKLIASKDKSTQDIISTAYRA